MKKFIPAISCTVYRILILMMLVSMSPWEELYGQTGNPMECLPSPPPREFNLPNPTLCQRFHNTTFPNVWGGLGKQKASQIIALNMGNNVFTGNIELMGDFEIDVPFTLLGCKVNIAPNIKITVNPSIEFTLDYSKLFACTGMWNGIKLGNLSEMITRNYTEIEDATIAMEAPCGNTALFTLTGTTFNRNYIGIKVDFDSPSVPSSCAFSSSVFLAFSGNVFDCTAPLNGTTNGVTYAGMQIYKGGGSIGMSANTPNIFANIEYGIKFESQKSWATTAIGNCWFVNTFDGIYSNNGRLQIEYCHFINCAHAGIYNLLTNGFTVRNSEFYDDDNIKSYSLGGNPNPPHIGIWVDDIAAGSRIRIDSSSFKGLFPDYTKREQFTGIRMTSANGQGGGSLRIENNTFEIIVVPANQGLPNSGLFQSAGIFIGLGLSEAKTTIQSNHIYVNSLTGFQPFLAAVDGIATNTPKNMTIKNNTFDSDGPPASATLGEPSPNDRAIALYGSGGYINSGIKVIENTVLDDPEHPNSRNFELGINSINTTNGIFCSNTLQESFVDMFFWQNSQGTRLFKNNLIVAPHSEGLKVYLGFIGVQGIEGGQHNQNRWFDEDGIPYFINYHATHVDQQLAPLSRIWVNTDQSTLIGSPPNESYSYFSEVYPAYVDPGTDWIVKDENGVIVAVDCYGIDKPEGDFADRVIADDSLINYVQDSIQIWTSKRYLYDKLKSYPEIIDDYVGFANFEIQEENTSTGKMYRVYKEIEKAQKIDSVTMSQILYLDQESDAILQALLVIDQILHSSTNQSDLESAQNNKIQKIHDLHGISEQRSVLQAGYMSNFLATLQNVLLLLNQVSPENNFEEYEKSVLSIIITSLLQNEGFSETQINVLESIAVQCPHEIGIAASFSRHYLRYACNSNLKLEENQDCYPEQNFERPESFAKEQPTKTKSNELTIYPNPTKDGLFVKTTDVHCPAEMHVIDYTGRTIYKKEIFACDQDAYMPINLQDGLYFCKFISASGEKQIAKFQVIN